MGRIADEIPDTHYAQAELAKRQRRAKDLTAEIKRGNWDMVTHAADLCRNPHVTVPTHVWDQLLWMVKHLDITPCE